MPVRHRRATQWGAYLPLYLMTVPGLLYLLVNNYLPMAGLVIAFKDIDFAKGIFGSDWIGFKNFEYLFSTSDALVITRNTIVYNVAFIGVNTLAGLVLAIVLNEIRVKFFSRFYQAVILLPMLISMVIVSYLGLAFLQTDSGFFNKSLLPAFGLPPVPWYSNADAWIFILPIVNLWKNVGFLVVVYFATVVGIDREMYEAATVDGAGFVKQTTSITLPLMVPVVVMTTLLAIGRIFYSDFGLFYQVPLNSGAIYDTTNVIDTYVYRGLMQLGDIGMAAAAGLYQSAVGLVLILISNAVVRRFSRDNAMF